MALFQLKQLKKSYRLMLWMTFAIITIALLVLLTHGYMGTSETGTTSFVMLYALFNIYMYIVAHLYSPVFEGFNEI